MHRRLFQRIQARQLLRVPGRGPSVGIPMMARACASTHPPDASQSPSSGGSEPTSSPSAASRQDVNAFIQELREKAARSSASSSTGQDVPAEEGTSGTARADDGTTAKPVQQPGSGDDSDGRPSGKPRPPSDRKPPLARAIIRLREHAASGADEELVIHGLRGFERKKIHLISRQLGLISKSDGKKSMHVVKRKPRSTAADEADKKPTGQAVTDSGSKVADAVSQASAGSDTKPGADGTSTGDSGKPASGPADGTKPSAPAASSMSSSPSSPPQGQPRRLQHVATPAPLGELPESPSELLLHIDKLTAALRASYGRLRTLQHDDTTSPAGVRAAGAVPAEGPEDAAGGFGDDDVDAGVPGMSLAEPISRQDIDFSAARELIDALPVVERTEHHVAITQVVGRVAGMPEQCADEANDAEFTRMLLHVASPIVRDAEEALCVIEVRAYTNVLAKYCARHVAAGDLVFVLGHALPELASGKIVVVLMGDGCHVTVAKSAEPASPSLA